MQESSGTRQEKFSVLMCCKALLLHGERGPSDPRLDTCTGSPKGARLVPREIDLPEKKRDDYRFLSFLPSLSFPSYLHEPSFTLNFYGKEVKRHTDKWLSSSLETNDPLVSLSLGTESGRRALMMWDCG